MIPPRPPEKTLAGVIAGHAARAPGHAAIIDGATTLSYIELLQRGERAARALLAQGLRRGDAVAILLGNEAEWGVQAVAASMIGVTLVPLNTWYKRDEIVWTLRHCRPRLVLSTTRLLKTDYVAVLGAVAEILQTEGALPPPVAFAGKVPPGSVSWDDMLREGDRVAAADLTAASAAAMPDAAAFILYTSGSTAEPKGVVLNHRGVIENGYDLAIRRGITNEDLVWLGSPLFYGLGATNAVPATFTCGATLVLQGHFEAGSAIDTIHRTGATVYYGTGNMTRAILDHADFSPTRVATLQKGNAGTVAEYKRMTLVEMGIAGAVPAYGLTETYGNVTVGNVDDPIEVKIAANGPPLPGFEMRIVDPDSGRDLPLGETGLVLVRGHTTPGYLGNPTETAKALRPDGFFDTGDLGRLDANGHFIFHARLKEVIKSGGINVSPVEVEQLLASHPGIRDAYVVGVRDPVRGELVVAFVDVAEAVSAAELRAYVKERAAAFKVPHHILFRDEAQLPRLASGKIAKHRLRIEAQEELGL